MKRQSCHHQLICRANPFNGFYMMATFAFSEFPFTNPTIFQYFYSRLDETVKSTR